MSRFRQIISTTLLVILVASCSKDDDGGLNITYYKSDANTNIEKRLEVPKPLSGNKLISHSTKVGKDDVMTYCLEYDLTKFHSRWVAFRFDTQTRPISNSSRSDKWADDPDLDSRYHIGFGTFSGGVRGHICASHDRRYNQTANDQTFYMTNMSPMGYDFNGDYWTAFESYVQDLGRNKSFSDTLYVVKGGTINPGQTKGYARTSGGKSMVIPKYYFIALLRYIGGNYSSIGFWVEHKDYNHKGSRNDVRNAACTIDDLEEKTGIDFFHNLPDNKENLIESKLDLSSWQL